ncbi:endocytosis defective- protein [Geranomyces michiganensis]|nr:endocytosis defective- protein [Geranomyces michiganensis]
MQSQSQDFDWYISPAERFAAETQFAKYSEDEKEVALSQLQPLFQLSRLSEHEFSQIWQIIDIRIRQRINLEQFVYFAHVLNTRRKGKPIPSGVPLDVKEAFLKEPEVTAPASHIRPSTTGRDVGSSTSRTARELEEELARAEAEIRAARTQESAAREYLRDLETTKHEATGLADYKKREAAAVPPASVVASSGGGGGGGAPGSVEELLSKLQAEAQMLRKQQQELQSEIAAL